MGTQPAISEWNHTCSCPGEAGVSRPGGLGIRGGSAPFETCNSLRRNFSSSCRRASDLGSASGIVTHGLLNMLFMNRSQAGGRRLFIRKVETNRQAAESAQAQILAPNKFVRSQR